ncbi:putative phosphatidate phosphatase [Planococcus citri]|uniref:putative phosphatidate phosphatase n=1 Tax=Planococcus citri TaxID=170843 RepID=UPI0031F9AC61
MDTPSVDVLRPVITDLIVFFSLGSFDLYTAKIMKPFRRGFFCDDTSIRYPYSESTVPALVLNIVGTLIPLLLVFIGEYRDQRRNKKTNSSYHFGRYKIKAYYWSVYQKIVCFASGALFTLLITDVAKKVIGRLRPNFIDVCRIDMRNVCKTINYEYITNYTCAEGDSVVNESRVSFPSGHSSFSFYVAVFIVLYLEKRLKTRTFFLKPAIQFLVILLAWFVALSRVMDNKHHWSDVLCGILIGSSVAIINTGLVHSMFEDRKPSSASPAAANGNRTNGVSHEAHDQL